MAGRARTAWHPIADELRAQGRRPYEIADCLNVPRRRVLNYFNNPPTGRMHFAGHIPTKRKQPVVVAPAPDVQPEGRVTRLVVDKNRLWTIDCRMTPVTLVHLPCLDNPA